MFSSNLSVQEALEYDKLALNYSVRIRRMTLLLTFGLCRLKELLNHLYSCADV